MTPSSLSPLFYIQLVLKVKQQVDATCCWVCHGRFHGVLPKEQPGAFYDVPRGLYKEMPTNNHVQSDIITHVSSHALLLRSKCLDCVKPENFSRSLKCCTFMAKAHSPMTSQVRPWNIWKMSNSVLLFTFSSIRLIWCQY